jgi:hypothetical protein
MWLVDELDDSIMKLLQERTENTIHGFRTSANRLHGNLKAWVKTGKDTFKTFGKGFIAELRVAKKLIDEIGAKKIKAMNKFVKSVDIENQPFLKQNLHFGKTDVDFITHEKAIIVKNAPASSIDPSDLKKQFWSAWRESPSRNIEIIVPHGQIDAYKQIINSFKSDLAEGWDNFPFTIEVSELPFGTP